MKTQTQFTDINFKLAVIQELMYNQELLQPAFDLHKFADNYAERKIDIEAEGYDVIPEALAYFEQLPIPVEFLEAVEEIFQDGGDDIYLQIYPYWDGEDDVFNITQTDDLQFVPNLKSITLFYDDAEEMVDAFAAKAIEAEYL